MKLGPHLGRPSYYEWMIHQQDATKNTGFDYEKFFLERTTSKYLLVDDRKEFTFLKFQGLLVAIVNAVGMIKKCFNYTVPKNHRMNY
jgi:hypothetical protein